MGVDLRLCPGQPATEYAVLGRRAVDRLFLPQFGWRGDNTGGNAVQGFPLLGIDYWTPVSPGAEMQFMLHGIQEAIPVEVTHFSVD